MLFGEVGFLDRFAAAQAAGFEAVEFPFPYAYPQGQLVERLRAHGLTQVLINLPPGDWDRGERGIACLPERRGEFMDGVGIAIDYAVALGCSRVNCLAGVARGVAPAVAFETLVENLRFAAPRFASANIQLLIEPINTRDIPGFFLCQSAQALGVIDAVGSSNLWLQYDVYHMQVMQGYLGEDIRRCLPKIAHVQIADNPGRHQPGTGEIDYPVLLRHLERLGYAGWIGCEYHPLGTTAESLAWLEAYRSGRFG